MKVVTMKMATVKTKDVNVISQKEQKTMRVNVAIPQIPESNTSKKLRRENRKLLDNIYRNKMRRFFLR